MKIRFWNKKTIKKICSAFICLGLVLGGTGISPTVSAKTVYKTKVHNVKLEKVEDFKKGEMKNIKVTKNGEQTELSSEGEVGEYITPEVGADFEATHIGLHWQENSAKEQLLSVSLRVRNEGEKFGDWIEVTSELEDHPDDWKTDEIFASLVNVGNKKYAQAKINFVSQNGKTPKLKNITFTFLNSGEMAKETVKELNLVPKTGAESVGVLKTSIGGQNVNVISREMWGAEENYRLKADGQEDWPRSYHGTRKLVIHHTAVKGSNGETDISKNMEEVRSIYYYHAVTQGFGDIGYNALVDAAGNVYEGRYGTHGTSPTREENPTADQIMTPDVEAGHTAGYNSGSFGVAAMGEFTRFTPPTAQIEGLKKVLAYVADERGANAQGYSNFLRYDDTWHEDLYNFIGHREAVATACPGDKLYSMIQASIKNPVDALLHHNLSGFSVIYNGTINMESLYATKVESGTLDFSWDNFTDSDTLKSASGYQYMLERVFGTTGVASDSQPWETAWFFTENAGNVKTILENNVRVDSSALQSNSNYVFYVRALDENGKPLSTTKHFNFETGEIIPTEPVDPDEEAPTVAISSPNEGAIVSGDAVVIEAEASDNVGVIKVEFYANNSLIGSDSSSPYSINWDSIMVADGPTVITAKAFDLAGNQGVSNAVNIIVSNPAVVDTEAPTVVISSPDEDATVSEIIVVGATASDNVGVSKVEFYVNDLLIGSDSDAPYSIDWDSKTITDGLAVVTAKAFDLAGNIGVSNGINVVVSNPTVVDTEAPAVIISSPVDGGVVSGLVSIKASATDNVGVTLMELYIDEKKVTAVSAGSISYNWNTKKIATGSHTITVNAYDAMGNVGIKSIVVTK